MACLLYLTCGGLLKRARCCLLQHYRYPIFRGAASVQRVAHTVSMGQSYATLGFTRVYRFTNMRALVNVIKSVQYNVEDFAFGAEDLLVGTGGSRYSFRSESWSYDSDFMGEQVLLGFMRASSPCLLNSNYSGSPIVAAGLVRSHLEAVLFRKDLTASLEGQEPMSADDWYAALKLHRDAGHVTPALNQWVKQLYGLLSLALHSGATLSRGEVWAFRRVVDLLRDSLNSQQ